MTVVILLGSGARQMATPFVMAAQPDISLSPWALPGYGLRTQVPSRHPDQFNFWSVSRTSLNLRD
jgi:hypothetical protein